MYEPIVLYGTEGLEFIVHNGGMALDTSALINVEESFIIGTQQWLEFLKENGHYDASTPIYVASVYAKEKQQAHSINIEVSNDSPDIQGLGQNEHAFFWHDGTNVKQYLIHSGAFRYNVIYHFNSPQRASLARLVDVVKMGLEVNISDYLASQGVNLPAQSVTATAPEREEISKNYFNWKMDINIAGVFCPWHQVLEQDGEILKNYGWYVSRLNTINNG